MAKVKNISFPQKIKTQALCMPSLSDKKYMEGVIMVSKLEKLEETIYELEKAMGAMQYLHDYGDPDTGVGEGATPHWFNLFSFTLVAARKSVAELRAVHQELLSAESAQAN